MAENEIYYYYGSTPFQDPSRWLCYSCGGWVAWWVTVHYCGAEDRVYNSSRFMLKTDSKIDDD